MASEVVLITGASSGIGLALAELFAKDGAELILTARREDRLNSLAQELQQKYSTKTHVIPLDLALPEAPRQLADAVLAKGLNVDVLVNNAGFGQLGQFTDIPLDRQLEMVRLNISSLVALTHLFLAGMRSRNRGAILNLGSTAAFQPGPNCATYYATKAFVLSFSEAISEELRGSNISVTCLCPGPTRTEFAETAEMSKTLVFQANSMNVDDVALAGYRGVRGRKRLVMPGLMNKLLASSVRITPRGVILKVLSEFNKSRGPKGI